MGSNKPGPTSWVLAARDVENLLEQVIASQEVVIDLETTGLVEHATTGGSLNGGVAGRVALAALTLPMPDESGEWDGVEPTTYIWPLSHRDSPFLGTWRPQLTRLCQTILEHEKPLNNQNLKFDARWLYAMTGVDLSHLIVWDTEVSSSLLDETRSRKLKERAPETFDIPRWDDDMDFTQPGAAERADLMLLGEYGARDTYWTWRLAQNHREQMYLIPGQEPPYSGDDVRHARLGQIATWVSMPTVASMTAVEQRGFMLDAEWTKQRLDEEETKARELLADMASRFNIEGTPSTAPTSHWFGAWTQAAVDADQLRVIEITPNGKPSWSKRSLRKQAAQGNELAQLVLDQRGATKRSEYLRSWLGRQVPAGTIHARYNIGSVATGRLSSSEPNMQQVTASLKPAFIPRPGYLIAELDYSQIELRVAAFISRSQPMIEAYQRGDDLHRIIAANTVNMRLRAEGAPLITPADVTPEQRQGGKASNFGLLYGQEPYGFRLYAEDVYGVVMTEHEAVQAHTAFFDTWTGLREWHLDVMRRVRRDGYIVSPLGRIRRLPGIWDGYDKTVRHAENAAINSPVQGMASDMMQMSIASILGYLPGSQKVAGAHPIATVHDSIVLEVLESDWQSIVEEAKERMQTVDRYLTKLDVDFDVPLQADATVGTRWGLGDIHAD